MDTSRSERGRALRIAVVGAGPAGIYTAEALTQEDLKCRVDLIERLPVPHGLLRYGVAPDHLTIKSAGDTLDEILAHPRVQLLAHVAVGTDVSVAELRQRYDAVVYALGANADRRLGLPGEDLAGSMSATSLVRWYNGHPERSPVDLSTVRSVAVVGVGNVALDVARILLLDPDGLRQTDVSDDVLRALRDSAVTDVHVIGRRGPEHAKFTTKELREIGELSGVDVLWTAPGVPGAEAGPTPAARRNLVLFREWASRAPTGARRRLTLHFGRLPVELVGAGGHVTEIRVAADGDVTEGVPADLVVRAVGYRSSEVDGLPLDPVTHTVPTDDHRVLRDGRVSPGEYAVGWLKRGATGVLGTNRADAMATAVRILADLAASNSPGVGENGGIGPELAARSVAHVDASAWQAVLAAERRHGQKGRGERVKIPAWQDLLTAAGVSGGRSPRIDHHDNER